MEIKQTVGINTVKAYVAAIIDLWSFQKSAGLIPLNKDANEVPELVRFFDQDCWSGDC